MSHSRSSMWMVLGAAVAVFASVGCGSSKSSSGGGNDGSGGDAPTSSSTGAGAHKQGSGGGGGDGGMNTNSVGGGGTAGGGVGGSGGSTAASCDDYATGYCSKLDACSPMMFIAEWENMTICKTQVTAACQADKQLMGAGMVDITACTAAITASCDALLDPHPMLACEPSPGTGTNQTACTSQAQCASGFDCFTERAKPGCPGFCSQPYATGAACNGDSDLCDTANGAACVNGYGHPSAPTTCEVVTYGATNDPCKDGTEKQCGTGLACTADHHCVAVLQLAAPCVKTADICDARQLLSCETNKNGHDVCTQKVYVTAGAQCGNVNGVTQSCSAYAYCQGANPTTCAIKKMEGEACTAAPDNCYPGLECKAGTCQTPPAPNCN